MLRCRSHMKRSTSTKTVASQWGELNAGRGEGELRELGMLSLEQGGAQGNPTTEVQGNGALLCDARQPRDTGHSSKPRSCHQKHCSAGWVQEPWHREQRMVGAPPGGCPTAPGRDAGDEDQDRDQDRVSMPVSCRTALPSNGRSGGKPRQAA